ncbi:hypothetical protein KM043_010710 [Ampulex compressa]|nr:hypothetical protein KM043_010710 [Ampulex compressa]
MFGSPFSAAKNVYKPGPRNECAPPGEKGRRKNDGPERYRQPRMFRRVDIWATERDARKEGIGTKQRPIDLEIWVQKGILGDIIMEYLGERFVKDLKELQQGKIRRGDELIWRAWEFYEGFYEEF